VSAAICVSSTSSTGRKTSIRASGCLRQAISLRSVRATSAVIRIPTEEEEQHRHVHLQREALVRARTKLQAQGRALLVTHGQPPLQRWWRARGWQALAPLLPAWLPKQNGRPGAQTRGGAAR